MSEKNLNLIKESESTWVDLRFTDTKGKEQHVSIPASEVDADFFEDGKMFDGSSIAGWKGNRTDNSMEIGERFTLTREVCMVVGL